MIEAIKFVRGAVAKKDFVPELTHFRIKDQRITGFNGIIALSSPIDLDLDVRPKATTFAKAVQTCETTISMHVTPTGRLSVKSGKFRALIECLPDDHAQIPVAPEGSEIDIGPDFMKAVRAVSPFMGFDASRPWAEGIMLKNQSAYATNNVCFVEYWHGHHMPLPLNIPKIAVNELLRIGQDPERVIATQSSITFHYEDGRWLRSALLGDNWPEQAFTLFDGQQFNYQPMPEDLFSALKELKAFMDTESRVHFRHDGVATSASEDVGAVVEVEVAEGPVFNYKMLSLLEGIEQIDFTPHPRPCGFMSGMMRGLILGLNV